MSGDISVIKEMKKKKKFLIVRVFIYHYSIYSEREMKYEQLWIINTKVVILKRLRLFPTTMVVIIQSVIRGGKYILYK